MKVKYLASLAIASTLVLGLGACSDGTTSDPAGETQTEGADPCAADPCAADPCAADPCAGS